MVRNTIIAVVCAAMVGVLFYVIYEAGYASAQNDFRTANLQGQLAAQRQVTARYFAMLLQTDAVERQLTAKEKSTELALSDADAQIDKLKLGPDCMLGPEYVRQWNRLRRTTP